MGKKKKRQYSENKTFSHLFQPSYDEIREGFSLKGKWNEEYFNNDNPIILELGCGKGEYTIGQSLAFPENNYIGIDIKGARLWRGCKTAHEENISNVAFLRAQIELAETFFTKDEVSEIWITFPDPQLKVKRRIKRLTSPEFLFRYAGILKNGGIIHLKTDNRVLFDYTLDVIKETGQELLYQTTDLYNSDYQGPARDIKTFYEAKYLSKGQAINYLKFKFHKMEGVSFFEKVYQVVNQIPEGRVTSYGAIARYLGTGSSARMVGWAMNQSHTASLNIPAHRVVNREGMLTGKLHFGGSDVMQQLLESEGILIEDDRIVDFGKFYWDPAKELI